MRKLILSLIVLTFLVSCGKDNAVNGDANANANPIVTNPIVTNNTSAQDLISKINNPAAGFGTGTLYISTASTTTCKEKWILTYCSSSYGSGNQTTTTWNAIAASRDLTYRFVYFNGAGISKSYSHSSVAIAKKQSDLIGILNSATAIYKIGTVYTIIVSNAQYIIDTNYPIQANPIRTPNDSLYDAI